LTRRLGLLGSSNGSSEGVELEQKVRSCQRGGSKTSTHHSAQRVSNITRELLVISIGSLAHQDHGLTLGADVVVVLREVVRVDNVLQATIIGNTVLDESKGPVSIGNVLGNIGDASETVSESSHEGGGAHIHEGVISVEVVEERTISLLVSPGSSDEFLSPGEKITKSPAELVTASGLGNGLVDSEDSTKSPSLAGSYSQQSVSDSTRARNSTHPSDRGPPKSPR
jgi:hypothetical protein